MTRSCYDCENLKVRYDGTLYGEPYCIKYKKVIPISHLAQNFWCDIDAKSSEVRNRT